MDFYTGAFFAELDGYYARYDNAATEQFLLRSLSNVRGDKEAELVVLNEIACFYRNTSRWHACMDAFERLQAAMKAAGMEQTEDYALTTLNMAGAYRLMGRLDEALAAFERAGAILEKLKNASDYSMASLYNNTGLVYQDKRDFAKAAEYFERGLARLRGVPDTEAEVATSLANLAAAYFNSGERDKALERLEEALGIFAELDGGNNAHYAGALNTKAVMLYVAGDFSGAAAAFEKAIEKTKLIFGENKDYVSGCRNCAAAYKKLGDEEAAQRYLDMAEAAARAL